MLIFRQLFKIVGSLGQIEPISLSHNKNKCIAKPTLHMFFCFFLNIKILTYSWLPFQSRTIPPIPLELDLGWLCHINHQTAALSAPAQSDQPTESFFLASLIILLLPPIPSAVVVWFVLWPSLLFSTFGLGCRFLRCILSLTFFLSSVPCCSGHNTYARIK